MANDYELDITDLGAPRGEGESWSECCERLRGPRRRVHPLVLEVCGDV